MTNYYYKIFTQVDQRIHQHITEQLDMKSTLLFFYQVAVPLHSFTTDIHSSIRRSFE